MRGSQDPPRSMARALFHPPWRLPKCIFCFIIFLMRFFNRCLIALDSIFPPNLPPKNQSNRLKIDAKMPFQVDPIFSRCLFDFDSQLGRPNLENSSPHCRETMNYQESPFEVNIDFFFDSGANLCPLSFPKSMKIASKLNLGRHRFFV